MTLLLLASAFGLRAQDCQLLCNGDFEDGAFVAPNSFSYFENGEVPCWLTTASDSTMEIWGTGWGGVNAYSGVQFIELCANMFAPMYQDFTATPGQEVIINVAHRARMVAPDVMEVRIGHDGAWSVVATVSDGLAWVYHTYTYTLPVGGSNTFTLLFFPISSGSGDPSTGNFIDAVSISLPPPQVSLTNTPVTCPGAADGSAAATVVDGAVPFTYLWSPGGGTDTTATGLAGGSYLFTVTDANGCVDTASTTITEGTGPSLTLQGTSTLCNGASDGSALAVATSGSAPFTYQWSPAGGTNAQAVGLSAGLYTCTITDANGCSSTANVQIDEPPPVAVVAFDTLICSGTSATLLAQASGGTLGYTYAWSPDGPDVAPDATASYTVIATDANGCLSLPDTAVVFVPQVPQPVLYPDSTGCAPLCIPFAAVAAPDLSYAWHFGDGTTATGVAPLHCYQDPGSYSVSVTVTDTNGCSNALLSPDLITVRPSPTAAFDPSVLVTTLDRSTVLFMDQSTDAQSWFWLFGDADGTTSTTTSPFFRFPAVDCYTVTLTVTNAEACTDTASREICIVDVPAVFIPNSFTPDGDGINDSFHAVIVGEHLLEFELTVFDRWGGVIFSSNTPDSSWDGAGTPIGTYTWKLRYKDAEAGGKQLFGHVNLLR